MGRVGRGGRPNFLTQRRKDVKMRRNAENGIRKMGSKKWEEAKHFCWGGFCFDGIIALVSRPFGTRKEYAPKPGVKTPGYFRCVPPGLGF